MKRVELSKQFLHNMKRLDHRELESFMRRGDVEFVEGLCLDMALQMTNFVLAGCPEHVAIHKHWPKDWWQAFRLRWFPGWWLARWPVEYEHFDFERTFYAKCCPHLDAPLDQHIRWFVPENGEKAWTSTV